MGKKPKSRHPRLDSGFGRLLGSVVLGMLGTVAGMLLGYWALLAARNSSDVVRHFVYYSHLPAVACLWCAGVVLAWPRAFAVLVAVGYASTFSMFALFALADGHVFLVCDLLLSSGTSFVSGYLGQMVVKRCFPRRFRRTGRAQEPVCPMCGYGLYYVKDHVCPDCGKPFLSAEIDMRLAHWEDGVLKPWKGAGPAPLDLTLYDPLTSAPARSAKYDVPRRWEVPGYWSMYCRQLGDDWRALARQLRARPQFPHALWQEQGVSPELAEKILSFMVKALQWPNHYCAPHDPLWLVLLPVALDACDFAELMLDIGEEFGVTITDETVTQLYKREAPVVDFVRMIEAGMTGQHD